VTGNFDFDLVEKDPFEYESLGKFLEYSLGVALISYYEFWENLIAAIVGQSNAELQRYLTEVSDCSLLEVLLDSEFARDWHYHFIPNATYAGVVEALLGGVRDPVSTFEMFEANEFREDNAYYEKMRGFFRSKDEPRSFSEWLVHRAYHEGFPLGLRRMKNGVNPLPDWWEERFANMGKRDFWGRHVE
jgi:hypothetical protein